jgi:hypothetical protein
MKNLCNLGLIELLSMKEGSLSTSNAGEKWQKEPILERNLSTE